MNKITYILSIVILVFINLPGAVAQVMVEEHVHTTTCDHTDTEPCLMIGNIDQVQIDATRVKINQIRNTVSNRSLYEFDREQMPLYLYLPFDASILNTYTFEDFKGMVMENIVEGIIESNQCSGVTFNNYKVVFEPIYGIPEYGSIYDIQNFVASSSGPRPCKS